MPYSNCVAKWHGRSCRIRSTFDRSERYQPETPARGPCWRFGLVIAGAMARCEEGYLCDVCGQDVAEITDSDLYLRYVLGEVPPEHLPRLRERHIRCNPAMAQFIVDPAFAPQCCDGPFAKDQLDPAQVAEQGALVTRA